MVMPLDLFVTPYQGPGQQPSSATGFNSLAEYGTQLREEALKKRQLDQDMQKHQASLGVQQEEVRGKNAYYQDSVDARREASRNSLQGKHDEKRDAQVMKIKDAIRVAQRNNRHDEVQSLLGELTRLGFSVSEEDTLFESPEQKVDALAPTAPTAKPTAPGKAAPKPDPGFMGALGSFMEGDSKKPGAIQAEDPQSSPMPWETFGEKPAPAKPKKGGRFTIRDKDGSLVDTIDAPMEKEKDRSTIEAALAPFIDDPQNPEQQAAARRASETAQRAIATGMPPDKAYQLGLTQLNKEMGQYKAQKLPSAVASGTGGGGSGLGVGKQEQSRLSALDDNQTQFLFKLSQDRKIPDARKAIADISDMDRLLDGAGKENFQGGAALSRYMKAISGATVSEGEVDRIMGGAGAMSQWETKLNRYTNGGKLDDDLIRGLRGVAQRARETFNSRIGEVVQTGQGWFRENPGLATPEERQKQQKLVKGFFTGQWDEGATDKAGPSPKSNPDARKRLEDKLKGLNLD